MGGQRDRGLADQAVEQWMREPAQALGLQHPRADLGHEGRQAVCPLLGIVNEEPLIHHGAGELIQRGAGHAELPGERRRRHRRGALGQGAGVRSA